MKTSSQVVLRVANGHSDDILNVTLSTAKGLVITWKNEILRRFAAQNDKPATYLTLALVCVAAFALYARTLAPGLLDGDEGEFQTNIARLGVSHTGYPLFFLLGNCGR